MAGGLTAGAARVKVKSGDVTPSTANGVAHAERPTLGLLRRELLEREAAEGFALSRFGKNLDEVGGAEGVFDFFHGVVEALVEGAEADAMGGQAQRAGA